MAGDVLDHFIRLVEIPSPTGREGVLAQYLAGTLTGLGCEVRLDDSASLTGSDCGNLIARLPGEEGESILLSAHLDTIGDTAGLKPVVTMEEVRSDGGSVLGADDKAGIAAIIAALEALVESGAKRRSLEVLFTVSEETGLRGAKALQREDLVSAVGFVLDGGEPVGNVIVRAPSQTNIAATFLGKAAHAGVCPEDGRSAVTAACRAVAGMEQGRIDEETTCNVGVIAGGKATNIVPEECVVRMEARSMDEGKLAERLQAMIDSCNVAAAAANVGLELSLTPEYFAFHLDARAAVVKMAEAALQLGGYSPRLIGSGGGSDANVLNHIGIPTVNLGIGAADVHSNRESIAISELEGLSRFVRDLVAVP